MKSPGEVRASFSDSRGPAEWIMRLIDEFDIDQERAEIFACGWFAGKYAGVSEVFQVVQREIDQMEKDQVERAEKENKYPPPDGYAWIGDFSSFHPSAQAAQIGQRQ